jgi:hypothetical protein
MTEYLYGLRDGMAIGMLLGALIGTYSFYRGFVKTLKEKMK